MERSDKPMLYTRGVHPTLIKEIRATQNIELQLERIKAEVLTGRHLGS